MNDKEHEHDNINNGDIIFGVCCICGHKLYNHIDEGEGWMCHSMARDFLHCECWLRKERAEGNIEYYDYFKRKLRALKEEEVDLTVKRNRDLFLSNNEKKYVENF